MRVLKGFLFPKKQVGCFNHSDGYPGCRQTDSGYERFALVLETSCIETNCIETNCIETNCIS